MLTLHIADPQKSSHSRGLYGHCHLRASYILRFFFFAREAIWTAAYRISSLGAPKAILVPSNP